MVLQNRDLRLLRETGVMRVIDREQAKCVAGFGSTTRANARLLALYRAGLLRRFWLGTTASGKKAIYALSAKGAALAGVLQRGPRRANGLTLATDVFVAHQFEINQVYCAVKYGPKPQGTSFVRWLSFYESLRNNVRLIPDGYFEMKTLRGTLAAFVEIDRTTESLGHWEKKIKGYLQFAVSGDFKKQFRQEEQFFVLVIANSQARLQTIRKTVAKETAIIFRFATSTSVHEYGLFGTSWLRPREDEPQRLIKESA